MDRATPMTDALNDSHPVAPDPFQLAFAYKEMQALAETLEREHAEMRRLLADEHILHVSISSPWACADKECPCFNHPMRTHCGCFLDAHKEHSRKVHAAMGPQ